MWRIPGKFINETDLGENFAFLRAQASATGCRRGDGRIGMLLGAIERY